MSDVPGSSTTNNWSWWQVAAAAGVAISSLALVGYLSSGGKDVSKQKHKMGESKAKEVFNPMESNAQRQMAQEVNNMNSNTQRQSQTVDPSQQLSKCLQLASYCMMSGKYSEAVKQYNAARTLLHTIGPFPLQTAHMGYKIAECYTALLKYKLALNEISASLKILQDSDEAEYIQGPALMHLAKIYNEMYQFKKAKTSATKALTLLRIKDENGLLLDANFLMITICLNLGEYSEATTCLIEAKRCLETNKEINQRTKQQVSFFIEAYQNCVSTCNSIKNGDAEEIEGAKKAFIKLFTEHKGAASEIAPVMLSIVQLLLTAGGYELALTLVQNLPDTEESDDEEKKAKSQGAMKKHTLEACIYDILGQADNAKVHWDAISSFVPPFKPTESFSKCFACVNPHLYFKKPEKPQDPYLPEYRITLCNKQNPLLTKDCKLQITFDSIDEPKTIDLTAEFLSGDAPLAVEEKIDACKMENKMFAMVVHLYDASGNEIDTLKQYVPNRFSYDTIKTYKQLVDWSQNS